MAKKQPRRLLLQKDNARYNTGHRTTPHEGIAKNPCRVGAIGRRGDPRRPEAEFDYTPGYYAVFIADPDGIKLELLHRPTFWEAAGE